MPRIWTYRWPANAGNDASFALDGATQFDGDGDGYDLWSQLLGPGEPYLIPMYPISDLYKQYLASRSREWLAKVTIDEMDYGAESIVEFTVENNLIPADEFTIGTAIVSKCIVTLRTDDVIAPNAKVIPQLAMTGAQGDTEWLPLGEFYIDRRELVNDRLWRFECLDKLVFAAVPYISRLSYPASMQDVWDEICTDLGYTYDDSVVINPSYTLPVAPTGFTCLQVLGYIAGCNAASVYIDKGGILRFKQFSADDEPVIELSDSEYSRVKILNPPKTYTRIVVQTDDEGGGFEAGSGDENHTLYMYNPLATQEIVDDLLEQLNGFSYVPVELDSPRGYPQLEVGDRFRFGRKADEYDVTWDSADVAWEDADWTWDGYQAGGGISLVLNIRYTFRGGLRMVIEAPSVSEQESEFGIDGSITEAINRINRGAVKLGKPYFGVTLTREQGLVIEKSDGSAKAVFNADELAFYQGGQRRLYFDAVNNRYVFAGHLEAATGTFSGALQAASGTFTGQLQGGSISIGSGNNVFRADTQGIWAGHADFASAPFRVNMAGQLVASNADITGKITGTSGTIGGWLIESGRLIGGMLFGGIIRGGEIETNQPGSYPRISLSTIGNQLIFEASASNYFRIYPLGSIFQLEIVYGSSLFFISKGLSGTTIGATDMINLQAPVVAVNGIPI